MRNRFYHKDKSLLKNKTFSYCFSYKKRHSKRIYARGIGAIMRV